MFIFLRLRLARHRSEFKLPRCTFIADRLVLDSYVGMGRGGSCVEVARSGILGHTQVPSLVDGHSGMAVGRGDQVVDSEGAD